MNRRTIVVAAGLLLAALAAAGSAWARNDRLMLPIGPAMRGDPAAALSSDIALRFGRASANGLEAAGAASAHGVADPFTAPNPNSGGQRVRRRDEVVCADAFRRAVADLQARARSVGASGVVGIVSNYNGIEMDSPTVYECHIGHTRGVVDLRGQFARGPLPVAVAPGVEPGTQPPRIASGFAAIDDIDAIPLISDRGRKQYGEWLGWPTPRAFAIAPTGNWYATSGLKPREPGLPTDPSERALLMCERAAGMPCWLYAVNGAVVWTKDPK